MLGKYKFIRLEHIKLHNFSLYTKQGRVSLIDEEIHSGVYCLAGANGLGKTTFLNIVNYGLTGLVLDPTSTMYSPNEIINASRLYTDRYFSGRINRKDLPHAEIELTISIGDIFCRIVRGFINREDIREFEVYSMLNNRKVEERQTFSKKTQGLTKQYEEFITNKIGFSEFNYFVFYQLYVFTFDENRRMIFWDERGASNALAIAFNSNPKDANWVSELARLMEKHESNGRNARWQATQTKKKMEELANKTNRKRTQSIEKIERELNQAYAELEKYKNLLQNSKIEEDTLLKWQSKLNADIFQLKLEHRRLFTQYTKPRSKLLESSALQVSLHKKECCLCGAHGNYIVDRIMHSVQAESCPLCQTTLDTDSTNEQNELFNLIEQNDSTISLKNNELENLINEIEIKRVTISSFEIEVSKFQMKIDSILEENPDLTYLRTGTHEIDSLLEQYSKQFEMYDKEARDEYQKRDNLKPEYDKLISEVESSYKSAEEYFVPTFKQLAKRFIGYDLNIHPKRTNRGIKLVLELKETARTEAFQLSESQRFFLDIALRMSLAIYLSNKDSPATLFIDTPEGSLDIAYESRVGNMFADFSVMHGQNLFMTSNINASQLLVSLAEKCGHEKMKFRRMLDWTDLSAVQKEGEHLFQQVYTTIEKAFNQKKVNK